MPRIQGVDIPNDKATYVSLTYLLGIGRSTALDICHRLRLDPQAKAGELSEDDVVRISNHLDKEVLIEGPLRRKVQQEISRLRDIRCYRGLRHRRGLPVRGQRTRTNARTRKGVKKTVAGRKGVKDMRNRLVVKDYDVAAPPDSEVLAKIDARLAECGTDKSKLLWAQLWVTDMRNFAAMNEVWDAWIDPANSPVRAGLCSALSAPDWKVEIMGMAAT